jgi:hypothetical protein
MNSVEEKAPRKVSANTTATMTGIAIRSTILEFIMAFCGSGYIRNRRVPPETGRVQLLMQVFQPTPMNYRRLSSEGLKVSELSSPFVA